MTQLVLSLFPGLDVLGMGFEAEGFAVVSGPDVVWGRDVRAFHPPAGKFDGIVGGPPCQQFSTLANLVRAKGLEPRFGNLIPEFVRCIEEAQPTWFLMENVDRAPSPEPNGYSVTTFVIDNAWLDAGDGFGSEQMRKRRFWFGWPSARGTPPDLSRKIRFACFELPKASRASTVVAGHDKAPGQRRKTAAVLSDRRQVPVRIGGSGKLKKTAVLAGNGTVQRSPRKVPAVTGRHQSNGMGDASRPGAHAGNPPRYSLDEMLRLQGLPPEVLDHAPFTAQGARKLVGNAVPYGMARELARAVREVIGP